MKKDYNEYLNIRKVEKPYDIYAKKCGVPKDIIKVKVMRNYLDFLGTSCQKYSWETIPGSSGRIDGWYKYNLHGIKKIEKNKSNVLKELKKYNNGIKLIEKNKSNVLKELKNKIKEEISSETTEVIDNNNTIVSQLFEDNSEWNIIDKQVENNINLDISKE